mgnify:CR=1 FL=1
MDGGSVHLYDITPAAKTNEIDNVLNQKEQESKKCNS